MIKSKPVDFIEWLLILKLMLALPILSAMGQSKDLVIHPVFTGNISGHLADIEITNTGPNYLIDTFGPVIIYTKDKYSPVWIESIDLKLSPGESRTFEAEGISLMRSLMPPPKGYNDFEEYNYYAFDPEDILGTRQMIDNEEGVSEDTLNRELHQALTFPGTQEIFPYIIDPFVNPGKFSSYVFEAQKWLRSAYSALEEEHRIHTVLSSTEELQKDYLTQIATWYIVGRLTGSPYTVDDNLNDLILIFTKKNRIRKNKITGELLYQLRTGSEGIWNNMMVMVEEAGVIRANTITMPDAIEDLYYCLCNIDGFDRIYPVNQRKVCDFLPKGKIVTADQLNASYSKYKNDFTYGKMLKSVSSYIGSGESFEIDGTLNLGNADISNLLLRFEKPEEEEFEVEYDRNTGAFTYDRHELPPGYNYFELIAETKDLEKKVLAGSYQLETEKIQLREGEFIKNAGKTLFIEKVRTNSITFKDGTLEAPLNVGRKYFFGEAVFELLAVHPQEKSIEASITTKSCPHTIEQHALEVQNMDEAIPGDRGGYGYKNLLVNAEVGYTPAEITIGIPTYFEMDTRGISCGWYHLDDLSFLQDSLYYIVFNELRSIIREKIRNDIKVNIILIDPITRRYVNSYSGTADRERQKNPMILKRKLPNPDLIVDLNIRVSCCESFDFASCYKTPIELLPIAYLVDARNGLILESFDPKVDVLKRHQKDICLDPASQSFSKERMQALVDFVQESMDHLSDYFVYFHLK